MKKDICECGHERKYHVFDSDCTKVVGGKGLNDKTCSCKKFKPQDTKKGCGVSKITGRPCPACEKKGEKENE